MSPSKINTGRTDDRDKINNTKINIAKINTGRTIRVAAAALAMVGAATVSMATTAPQAEAAGCYTNDDDGTVSCHVWRDAPTYYGGNKPTGGQLDKGWNYFYCQAVGDEVSVGDYRNHWWLQTDDDNGHDDVYVNAVYVSSGTNNEPIPGVPMCDR